MVRFSCFHSHKSKKAVQRPTEPWHKLFKDSSQNQPLKPSAAQNSLKPLILDTSTANPPMATNTCPERVTSSPSDECYWKSQEMHSSSRPEGGTVINQRMRLNKIRSLGSGLDRERRISSGTDIEAETGESFSSEDPLDKNYDQSSGGSDHSGLKEPSDSHDPDIDLLNMYSGALGAESFHENDNPGHIKPTFTIGDSEQLIGNSDDSGCDTPTVGKSCSMPNIKDFLPKSGEVSPSQICSIRQVRSSQNLDDICAKGRKCLSHEESYQAMTDQDSDDKMLGSNKDENGNENSFSDVYDSYNSCSGVTKYWTDSGIDKQDMVQDCPSESSMSLDELPSKDFNIKRIEDWVSTINLEDGSPFQETAKSSHSTKVKRPSDVLGNATANMKLDSKSPMEVAKNYIFSLSPASTSAQMVNLGLVMIPFLSAFVNLRVLNLSGNAIVRITAGALPRGLHILNLSKNNISTIEGLRELTRLRVLDMSYNRISRIGHGFASCSSLKELYLAGNKIGEVEGLHRLLKLNILDLRFNKISTSKCLGQVAANHMSLQTISLEGNPAQRNVGDEQLKKYLQSLLPHLVYYNKQSIRANSSKEGAARSARSAQRKGIPSAATSSKVSSSMIHGGKVRHGRVPLVSGTTKRNAHHPRHQDEKLLNLQSNLSMRRSQSEGFLGAS